MKITAIIMAGGKGERFWPKSRQSLPKQFLSLTGDGKTMIQLTAQRLLPIMEYSDMFVVTNQDYVGLVQEQLPEIPAVNILAEPMVKNTAPCVGFAAAVIQKKYKDAVMLVLASDHLITNNELYLDTMKQAADVAQQGENLVTIGITPTYPETGYGYIHFQKRKSDSVCPGIYQVDRFVEKPDLATAKEYLQSGEYLWNSGMFVWKVSTILKQFQRYLPQMHAGLEQIGQAFGTPEYEKVLAACFQSFEPVSVDHGIMEKANKIYTLPGSFGWDDVGSWLALERINSLDEDGNVKQGDVISLDTKDCILVGGNRLLATVGLEEMVVVDAGDAVMVCPKHRTQDVKKMIEMLRYAKREEMI